jgi:hypothetical protein
VITATADSPPPKLNTESPDKCRFESNLISCGRRRGCPVFCVGG